MLRVFIVLSTPPFVGKNLEDKILTEFREHHLSIGLNMWAVARMSATTKEIADVLGITPDAASGGGAVFAIDAYYGHSRKDIWDWMAVKMAGVGAGG